MHRDFTWTENIWVGNVRWTPSKNTEFWLAKSITINSTLWERFAWVKQQAKTEKMKEGFF